MAAILPSGTDNSPGPTSRWAQPTAFNARLRTAGTGPPGTTDTRSADTRPASIRGLREIAATDFYQSYLTTALRPDELLAAVRFPAAGPDTGAAFCEVSRRRGDFAMAGVAAQVTLEDGAIADARICASGVAAVPLRCAGSERALLGSRADPGTLRLAVDAALDILDPADDLHATAGYRKHVAGVLLRRAVAEAYGNATGASALGHVW